MPFSFCFIGPQSITNLMVLRFDFAATKRCLAVLGLSSNMFVNKHSDFLALGFLTGFGAI